jgi:hypothetical protein
MAATAEVPLSRAHSDSVAELPLGEAERSKYQAQLAKLICELNEARSQYLDGIPLGVIEPLRGRVQPLLLIDDASLSDGQAHLREALALAEAALETVPEEEPEAGDFKAQPPEAGTVETAHEPVPAETPVAVDKPRSSHCCRTMVIVAGVVAATAVGVGLLQRQYGLI